MKWSSKGQIGMMEMIMVLVVITILLVIGMVFYFKFSASHTEKIGERISEDKAAIIVSTVSQLPEIECTYLGSRTSNCADTIKLHALSVKENELGPSNSEFIEHRRHYSNLFGYMTIKFEQLYPSAANVECDVAKFSNLNYPETPPISCGTWTVYNNPKPGAEPTFRTMPIALYYPSVGLYTFGQLKIYTY